MSVALPSPGHQLTIPEGGAVHGAGLAEGVGDGLGDGDELGDGDAVGVGVGAVTGKHCENSDVFPNPSVAVAVITFPPVNATVKVAAFVPAKLALQALSVVTILDPRKVRPSPKSLGAVPSQ